jgi:hypothetical protein
MLRIRFIPTTKAPINMGTNKTATNPNSTISWPLSVLLLRAVTRLFPAAARGTAGTLIAAPS